MNTRVLATVSLSSELASRDNNVISTLTRSSGFRYGMGHCSFQESCCFDISTKTIYRYASSNGNDGFPFKVSLVKKKKSFSECVLNQNKKELLVSTTPRMNPGRMNPGRMLNFMGSLHGSFQEEERNASRDIDGRG
ncbi:hypothetical protein Tco_0684598 [Tanacetum coccineum]